MPPPPIRPPKPSPKMAKPDSRKFPTSLGRPQKGGVPYDSDTGPVKKPEKIKGKDIKGVWHDEKVSHNDTRPTKKTYRDSDGTVTFEKKAGKPVTVPKLNKSVKPGAFSGKLDKEGARKLLASRRSK